jgi:hypothetical protein
MEPECVVASVWRGRLTFDSAARSGSPGKSAVYGVQPAKRQPDCDRRQLSSSEEKLSCLLVATDNLPSKPVWPDGTAATDY